MTHNAYTDTDLVYTYQKEIEDSSKDKIVPKTKLGWFLTILLFRRLYIISSYLQGLNFGF